MFFALQPTRTEYQQLARCSPHHSLVRSIPADVDVACADSLSMQPSNLPSAREHPSRLAFATAARTVLKARCFFARCSSDDLTGSWMAWSRRAERTRVKWRRTDASSIVWAAPTSKCWGRVSHVARCQAVNGLRETAH